MYTSLDNVGAGEQRKMDTSLSASLRIADEFTMMYTYGHVPLWNGIWNMNKGLFHGKENAFVIVC